MIVSALIERFLAYHQEHNKPSTVVFYRQGLRWFRAAFGDREWSSLTRDEVKAAMVAANTNAATGELYAPDTQRRNIIVVDLLQKWCELAELIDAPVLKKPDLKKPGGRRREVIPTDEQIAAILEKAGPEFRLALASLRQSGMRPGELCAARIESIDKGAIVLKDHKTARKIGRPRRIAIGGKMAELVAQAIGSREEGPIWRDEKGNAWTPPKLSRKFRQLRDALDLPKELVLYSHRHYFATKVTRAKGIAAAQHALGHRNISTTQRYNHPDDQDMREAQDLV